MKISKRELDALIKSPNVKNVGVFSELYSENNYFNAIESKVNRIICDLLGLENYKISPESHLIKDLGADSLDAVELIMEFEKVFNIVIHDEDAVRMEYVKDIYNYLYSKVYYNSSYIIL